MNPGITILACFTALGAGLGWFITYLIMDRRLSRRVDELMDLMQAKYEEGYQAHRTKLIRQIHDGARTHVPHDEENPRPITIRRNALRVRQLPKLPGRN